MQNNQISSLDVQKRLKVSVRVIACNYQVFDGALRLQIKRCILNFLFSSTATSKNNESGWRKSELSLAIIQ
jgi:hypothetical protein